MFYHSHYLHRLSDIILLSCLVIFIYEYTFNEENGPRTYFMIVNAIENSLLTLRSILSHSRLLVVILFASSSLYFHVIIVRTTHLTPFDSLHPRTHITIFEYTYKPNIFVPFSPT